MPSRSRRQHLPAVLVQGSPLGRPFGIFVDRARVTMLGLVPSIARAWRASNCMQVRSAVNCRAFAPLATGFMSRG